MALYLKFDAEKPCLRKHKEDQTAKQPKTDSGLQQQIYSPRAEFEAHTNMQDAQQDSWTNVVKSRKQRNPPRQKANPAKTTNADTWADAVRS